MSAFIIGEDMLDLLVTAGVWGVGDDARLRFFHEDQYHTFNKYEDGDALGQILKTANYESVNYRYKEETPVETYRHMGSDITPFLGGAVISWGQVLQAVRCYEYQSCEAPTWDGSLAKAICSAITRKVCGRIADEADAEWEWTREHAKEIRDTIKEGLKS